MEQLQFLMIIKDLLKDLCVCFLSDADHHQF